MICGTSQAAIHQNIRHHLLKTRCQIRDREFTRWRGLGFRFNQPKHRNEMLRSGIPFLPGRKPGEYLTHREGDEAVKLIRQWKDRPFFLQVAHYAVHTPIQAKDDVTAKYKQKTPGEHQKNAKYAAMIESVDDSVGSVLKKLDELKLTDNTLVVFYSDNGGFGGATSNHPLRGAKGMLYEGGIREPLIVRLPGVTEPGSRCDEPVTGVDFYPTLLELTGTKRPDEYQLDGESLVSLLHDPTAKLAREAIFWHFPCYLQGSGDPHGGPFRTTPAGAIRKGDWKLIEWFETGRLELYNLAEDISEIRDRSKTDSHKLEELHAAMKAWRKQVNAPIPTQSNPQYDPTAKKTKRR